MDECSMMVTDCTGSHCTLTAPSMTGMTSLTRTFSANFVSNFGFAFSLYSNRPVDIKFVGRLLTGFGIKNDHRARMTLAHAQMNHHVSHVGYWQEGTADVQQCRYTQCISTRYDVKNRNVLIHSSADAVAVNISSSESDFHLVMG